MDGWRDEWTNERMNEWIGGWCGGAHGCNDEAKCGTLCQRVRLQCFLFPLTRGSNSSTNNWLIKANCKWFSHDCFFRSSNESCLQSQTSSTQELKLLAPSHRSIKTAPSQFGWLPPQLNVCWFNLSSLAKDKTKEFSLSKRFSLMLFPFLWVHIALVNFWAKELQCAMGAFLSPSHNQQLLWHSKTTNFNFQSRIFSVPTSSTNCT